MFLSKKVRTSLTTYFLTLNGNWGNPGLGGEDFGTIYFDIITGEQGALDTGRQLIWDNFNNSYISANSGTLKYTTTTAFASVTSATYSGATTASSPQGMGTWYTYSGSGVLVLTANYVFYIEVGGTVYAFAISGYASSGTANNNQGAYTIEVKTL